MQSPASSAETVVRRNDYQVVELRRYTTAPGQRARFAAYFDAYFPEAFEQLGAMVFGQFLERGHPEHFTWLRGYKDMAARPIVDAQFYYGPVWHERRTKVNAILPDSDNVLLLRPLPPDSGVPVLPPVDPVDDAGRPRGIVVAQILAVRADAMGQATAQAQKAFETYRQEGVRDAGTLVSLDAQNNFPQLPIRTDGPFIVWLGVVRDDTALSTVLEPAMRRAAAAMAAGGWLRAAPEVLVMDPTPRSRLRWLAGGTAESP